MTHEEQDREYAYAERIERWERAHEQEDLTIVLDERARERRERVETDQTQR